MNPVRTIARASIFATSFLVLVTFMLLSHSVLLWWAIALVPLLLACWGVKALGRRVGEPDRASVTCALGLAAFVWILFVSVAASLLVLAILVAALPQRPWRRHVLGPVAIGVGAVALLHPVDRWGLGQIQQFGVFWVMLVHVAVLGGLVLMFALRRPSDAPAG
jgi:hypothetical protein